MKQDLCSVLEQEIDETRNVLQRITRDLKRLPKGKLEVGRVRNRYVQYHAVTWKNGRQVREYVGRENMKLAEQLAQQTYENKAKKAAERRLRGLEQALKLAVKTDLMEVYIRESPERKKLIIPLLSTDEQYIEQWYAEHPGDKNSFMKTRYARQIRHSISRVILSRYMDTVYHTLININFIANITKS